MNALYDKTATTRETRLSAPTPPRVALFSGNYNYHMDGPVRALNRLVGYLERRGVPVMVFSPTSSTPACEPAGTLVSIPSVPLPGRSEYRLGLGLPPHVKRQIEAFRPTLFHIAAPDLSGYAALKLARRWNIPAVASFHTRFDTYLGYYGADFLQRLTTAYLRHFYNQCQHLYAPSESMADVLRRQGMCDDIRIWSRGVDCAMFNPAKRDMGWRRALGLRDEDVAIAFVGRVVMEKGLDRFAAALQALRQMGVKHRPLIVGEGPALSWLTDRLPEAICTGFLRDEALSRAYASADIFFNPSLTETFGNVTAEAMACGLAVVCADATGSRSLITDGLNGRLITDRHLSGYTQALAHLAQDRDTRLTLGTAARLHAERMDWDRVLDGIYDHYVEALAQHAAEAAHSQGLPAHKPVLTQSAA